ncbi:MAG TPA: DUF2442 domain-containing protein [Clostridia bacterium]|nr:DUF2442 domain-containing protein [Clostridia bacterium]
MQDNILYGKEPLGPRVVSATPVDDYRLDLTFSNGERRIFDAKPLLNHRVFAPLKNKGFFESVTVAFGTIAWPGDIDYCPDTLCQQSVPYAPGKAKAQ